MEVCVLTRALAISVHARIAPVCRAPTMADEPMSAAAALIAVNEDERQIPFTETEVDAFARKVEDKVTDLVGGLSNWWSGVQTQVCCCSAYLVHECVPYG